MELTKRDRQIRKVYQDFYNVVLEDNLHVHHKIPIHSGGTNDISNLEVLTTKQHALAHLKLFIETGNDLDLRIYHLISGVQPKEVQLAWASQGGIIGGNKVKALGIGICTADKELRSKWASMGGKVGGAKGVVNKSGIHAQTPEERLKIASLGGKKGCVANGWLTSEVQRENGKKGGPKNKGFRWVTNDITHAKYTVKMQEDKPLEQFLKENPTFRLGRLRTEDEIKKNNKISS